MSQRSSIGGDSGTPTFSRASRPAGTAPASLAGLLISPVSLPSCAAAAFCSYYTAAAGAAAIAWPLFGCAARP